MALEIKGTVNDLLKIFNPEKLSVLIHVDYYRLDMIPQEEVFTITDKDLEEYEKRRT